MENVPQHVLPVHTRHAHAGSWVPVAAAVSYFYLCTYVMVVVQLSIEFRKETTPVLDNDVLFDLLPEIRDAETLVELVVNGALFYTLGSILIRLRGRKRKQALCHAFVVGGSVYLLRAAVLASTPLPNPFLGCDTQLSQDTPMAVNALLVVLKMRRTCRDVMFSGHAMSLSLFAMVARYYLSKTEGVLLSVYAAGGCVLLAVTRFHYTADVLVAVFITVPLFLVVDMYYRYALQRLHRHHPLRTLMPYK